MQAKEVLHSEKDHAAIHILNQHNLLSCRCSSGCSCQDASQVLLFLLGVSQLTLGAEGKSKHQSAASPFCPNATRPMSEPGFEGTSTCHDFLTRSWLSVVFLQCMTYCCVTLSSMWKPDQILRPIPGVRLSNYQELVDYCGSVQTSAIGTIVCIPSTNKRIVKSTANEIA